MPGRWWVTSLRTAPTTIESSRGVKGGDGEPDCQSAHTELASDGQKPHRDLGRPSAVQLIFGRRITKRTAGRFRTRVFTADVDPSLYLDYKRSRIRQYYKGGRALGTETTINDTRDFGISRALSHLSDLRTIGREANRRLLDAQRMSHRCVISPQSRAWHSCSPRPTPASSSRV